MTTELRAVQLRLGDAEAQLARRAEEAQVSGSQEWMGVSHIVCCGWCADAR